MGCLCTRNVETDNQVDLNRKKVYSWDLIKDSNENPQNFIFESLVNDEVIEIPGSINGNQFLIRNCSNSFIYILDHMNTVTIDDCVNCKIVMGPVKGSVYIRDCTNCICVIACGQLRIRDSRRVWAFVHCETQPVLEASTAIYFGTYQLKYKQLEQHFKDANLNRELRACEVVYDFTPIQNENNWKFLESDNAYDYIKDPVSEEILKKLRDCEQTWFFSDTKGLKQMNLLKAPSR